MSLGNAFQYAGTKSLLISGWEVSDKVAPELMKSFYENLKKGMRKSKALQQAKLEYLGTASASRAHPFYWGGFYLLGDSAPLIIGRKGYNMYAFIGGMVVIIMGVFIYFLRKRTA
ncbi:MAG: CHAT domain-containing protein [Bacteroidota bacterium]